MKRGARNYGRIMNFFYSGKQFIVIVYNAICIFYGSRINFSKYNYYSYLFDVNFRMDPNFLAEYINDYAWMRES